MFNDNGTYTKLSEMYKEELSVIYSYYKKVVCYLMSKGLSYEDAQDATQEAYMDAIESIGTLRDINSAKSWLFTIAWRRGLKYINKNDKRKKHEESIECFDEEREKELAVSAEAELDNALEISTNHALNRAMKRLSVKERQIIIMYYICEYRYSEIAEMLGMNSSTVRSKSRRALEKLRKALLEEYE